MGSRAAVAGVIALAFWFVGSGIFCFPTGLALGLVTWAMAGHALARMRRGLMDPHGRAQTEEAGRLGRLAVCLSLLGGALAVWLFLALIHYYPWRAGGDG